MEVNFWVETLGQTKIDNPTPHRLSLQFQKVEEILKRNIINAGTASRGTRVIWKKIIISFLNKRNPGEFWKALLKAWPSLYRADKLKVFQFLYTAGQWQNFTQLFLLEIDNEHPTLPWALQFAIIREKGFSLPEAQQDFLVTLFRSKKVEISGAPQSSEIIDALKNKEKISFLGEIQKKRQELLESARIARSERLVDQHLYYLNELKKIFPKDLNVQENIHKQQRSDAEQVLARSKNTPPPLSPEKLAEKNEDDAYAENLKNQAKVELRKNPNQSIDLAFMFRHMGYSKVGLDFLSASPDTERASWLLFDFLIQSKQYLSLLDHCETMKAQSLHSNEALFAISYFEALTYWELGEQKKAVDLMRTISKSKPHFRSATEILSVWLEEVN